MDAMGGGWQVFFDVMIQFYDLASAPLAVVVCVTKCREFFLCFYFKNPTTTAGSQIPQIFSCCDILVPQSVPPSVDPFFNIILACGCCGSTSIFSYFFPDFIIFSFFGGKVLIY